MHECLQHFLRLGWDDERVKWQGCPCDVLYPGNSELRWWIRVSIVRILNKRVVQQLPGAWEPYPMLSCQD